MEKTDLPILILAGAILVSGALVAAGLFTGGSHGLWAYSIEQGNFDEETKQWRSEYLDSVDALLDQFDACRAAITINPDKD